MTIQFFLFDFLDFLLICLTPGISPGRKSLKGQNCNGINIIARESYIKYSS